MLPLPPKKQNKTNNFFLFRNYLKFNKNKKRDQNQNKTREMLQEKSSQQKKFKKYKTVERKFLNEKKKSK